MKPTVNTVKNCIATVSSVEGTGIESYNIKVSAEKMWELKRDVREFAWIAMHNPQSAEGMARHMAFIFAQLLGMSKEEVFKDPAIQEEQDFWLND